MLCEQSSFNDVYYECVQVSACQRLEISRFAVYGERFCTQLFIILTDRSDASFDGNAHNITDDSSMPEEDDWGQESGVENLSDLSRLNITSDSRILEESIAEEPEQVGRWEGLRFSFLIFQSFVNLNNEGNTSRQGCDCAANWLILANSDPKSVISEISVNQVRKWFPAWGVGVFTIQEQPCKCHNCRRFLRILASFASCQSHP